MDFYLLRNLFTSPPEHECKNWTIFCPDKSCQLSVIVGTVKITTGKMYRGPIIVLGHRVKATRYEYSIVRFFYVQGESHHIEKAWNNYRGLDWLVLTTLYVCLSVCTSGHCYRCTEYVLYSRINNKTDQEGIEGSIEMEGLKRKMLNR